MRTFFLIILFTVFSTTATSAKPKTLHELGVKAIDLTYDLQFEEAQKVIDEMIRLEPKNAMGYFFKSASNFWMLVYYNRNEDEYKESTSKAIDIAKSLLKKNKDDTDALFYLGCAYGKLGYYYGSNGSFLKAMWNGRKGIKYLSKVIEKDPDYYDAYVGIGMYDYYLSVLPKIVRTLSFLGAYGDREKGLEEIILTSSKGTYAKGEAKIILADIYLDEENNAEAALPLLKELTSKYPHNHFNWSDLAGCYRSLKKHDLAVQTLDNSLQFEQPNKLPYYQGRIYYDLGTTYFEMNKFNEAVLAFKNAHTISKPETWIRSRSLFRIGECYEMMRSTDKAHEYFSQIKKEDDKDTYKDATGRMKNSLTPALIDIIKGSNYIKCGEYTQAEKILNDLLESELNKNPQNNTFITDVCFNIGIAEYELKKYQDSIQTFRKVLASNDVNKDWVKPWSHYYIGNSYRDIGETEKAQHEYDIAYKHEGSALKLRIDSARRKME